MQHTRPRKQGKKQPHKNSYAVRRFGVNRDAPVTTPDALLDKHSLAIESTANGFSLNGVAFNLKDYMTQQTWATLQSLHQQLDASVYRKILAAIVVQMNIIAASAKNICFQDPHNTGVGVLAVDDGTEVTGIFAGNMTEKLIAGATCGAMKAVDCSQEVLDNVTSLFNYMYHDPSWVNKCIEATMKKVGSLSISDSFHLDHVKCVWQTGHDLLHKFSTEERNQLTAAHESSNGAAVAFGILIPLCIIGCITGYLCHYSNKHGHLPGTDRKCPDPADLFGKIRRPGGGNYAEL